MADPAYTFTVPSVFDDLALDCRLYHPEHLSSAPNLLHIEPKGAIVAHPYAPLGGCYDDPVVLSVTKTLLQQGYIVGTFNFRGAGGSQGRSSWSGRGEIEDYVSFVGFILHYLTHLRSGDALEEVSRYGSVSNTSAKDLDSMLDRADAHVQLLLGGYSFGSLVLARLPSIPAIQQRFTLAERESTYSDIVLRARTLAKDTYQSLKAKQDQIVQTAKQSVTGQASPTASPRLRASTVTVGGGEATSSSSRRQSHGSKKSTDVVREIPHRIKTHIRRHSNHSQKNIHETSDNERVKPVYGGFPLVSTKYLMISPVMLPFTAILAPPGLPFTFSRIWHEVHESREPNDGLMSLKYPSLVVFGSSDTFSSVRKLEQWASTLHDRSSGLFEWALIDGAGHFWREDGALVVLGEKIASWTGKSESYPMS